MPGHCCCSPKDCSANSDHMGFPHSLEGLHWSCHQPGTVKHHPQNTKNWKNPTWNLKNHQFIKYQPFCFDVKTSSWDGFHSLRLKVACKEITPSPKSRHLLSWKVKEFIPIHWYSKGVYNIFIYIHINICFHWHSTLSISSSHIICWHSPWLKFSFPPHIAAPDIHVGCCYPISYSLKGNFNQQYIMTFQRTSSTMRI